MYSCIRAKKALMHACIDGTNIASCVASGIVPSAFLKRAPVVDGDVDVLGALHGVPPATRQVQHVSCLNGSFVRVRLHARGRSNSNRPSLQEGNSAPKRLHLPTAWWKRAGCMTCIESKGRAPHGFRSRLHDTGGGRVGYAC
eukprot:4198470-Pleurochrysis_carterae.AAC.1